MQASRSSEVLWSGRCRSSHNPDVDVDVGTVSARVVHLLSLVALLIGRVRSDLGGRVPDIELDAMARRSARRLAEAGYPLRIIAVGPDEHSWAGYRQAVAAPPTG
jgi:hypothetical protein